MEEKHIRIDELELEIQKFEWDKEIYENTQKENVSLRSTLAEMQFALQKKERERERGAGDRGREGEKGREDILTARVLCLQRLISQTKDVRLTLSLPLFTLFFALFLLSLLSFYSLFTLFSLFSLFLISLLSSLFSLLSSFPISCCVAEFFGSHSGELLADRRR